MTTAIVADDDQPNLELLSELLEINNIKIIDKVQNGKEAVISFQKLKPDVVFLDIMMPEFDGLYALEEIRKIDPSSIVIMITADTSDETSDRLDNLQPTAIVHKPYEMNSVIHFLKLQLELKEISKD